MRAWARGRPCPGGSSGSCCASHGAGFAARWPRRRQHPARPLLRHRGHWWRGQPSGQRLCEPDPSPAVLGPCAQQRAPPRAELAEQLRQRRWAHAARRCLCSLAMGRALGPCHSPCSPHSCAACRSGGGGVWRRAAAPLRPGHRAAAGNRWVQRVCRLQRQGHSRRRRQQLQWRWQLHLSPPVLLFRRRRPRVWLH